MDVTDAKPKKKIQSSIPELTVGEERKLFNQIRKSAAYITPDTLLFNGWTAGGFALTYIIQHHMKRKRKAEEKTNEEETKKRPRTKAFEDPLTMTSLDDKESVPKDEPKPKPKRKVAQKKKEEVPEPLPLKRQTCEGVSLEFCEIKDISEANTVAKKSQPKANPAKPAKPAVKKPRKKADPVSAA